MSTSAEQAAPPDGLYKDLVASFGSAFIATVRAIAHHYRELCVIALGSLIAYVVTRHYIPTVARILFRSNLFGLDINKATLEDRQVFATKRRAGAAHDEADAEFRRRVVPESLGILVGAVYLSTVMVLVVLLQPAASISTLSGPLTTITVMLLLGFVDDVLDVRWRYKMLLSMIGTLPLIMAYDGSMSVLIPSMGVKHVQSVFAALSPLSAVLPGGSTEGGTTSVRTSMPAVLAVVMARTREWLGEHLHLHSGGEAGQAALLYLGPLYLLYLSLLCTFCTNSINILAGVNGVEVGQSLVIAVASVLYNLCQLRLETVLDDSVRHSSPWLSSDHQLRALLLLGPFIGSSFALWQWNRYPARVFVGDSYTYFAGTVLAVAAVAGVYSKTLLLFFAPQLINFIISIPQLFGIVVCPRHRVPHWIPERDVLTNSHNYTLLNLILWIFGDMHEARLTRAVLTFQVLTCASGFVVRYLIAAYVYETVQ